MDGAPDSIQAVQLREQLLKQERTDLIGALQRSLLPAELPHLDHLRLAASFRPVGSQIVVGGDFYDVFASGAGHMVVLGDVCGKGPEAAAVAAMARALLRGVGYECSDPVHALEVLHRELLGHPANRYCTAVLVHLEPAGDGTLSAQVACAGHPRPVVVRADGHAEELAGGGMLLGVIDPPRVARQRTTLASGDSLVLYTDGLTDVGRRVGRPEFDVAGALAAIVASGEVAASQLVTRLEDAAGVVDVPDPPDDVAILAVQAALVVAEPPAEPPAAEPQQPAAAAPKDPETVGVVEGKFREANDRLTAGRPPGDDAFSVLCECGHPDCRALVDIDRDEYDALRAGEDCFAIVPGHEVVEAEEVLRRTERYWVVRKHGIAEAAADTLPDR